ncbi:MAG: hypothetical protein MSA07_06320 [Mucispirillum sp.]|nr:hypothetical protein [Mucispirillum sp.]
MHNLNLYSYYDKSLADINKEYLESLKNKPKRVSRKRIDKKVALAAAITLVTGLLVANYLGVFSEKVVEVVEAPPPVDTRTEEEKQGYVQIQIFEFADTPVETIKEPTVQDNNTIPADNTVKQLAQNNIPVKALPVNNYKETEKTTDNKKVDENKKQEVKKEKPVTKPLKQENEKTQAAAPVIKTYSILFENIDEKQYNKVKEISGQNNTKLEVVDAYSNTYSVWKVYEKSDTGSEMFGDNKVNHIEDFLTQNDAVEYAKNRNIDALIKQVGITEKTYTVKLCCSELNEAKQIAQKSNITDRIIKIVRAQ